MSFETALQQAVYNALSGVISCPVYDDAPYQSDGLPRDGMPFVIIGDDTAVSFDTDDMLGKEATVTLHVWSRSAGMKETKAIMGEIYDILHRGTLSATGYNFIDCLCEFSEAMRDGDGETRHGVVRYRVTFTDTGA